MLLMYGASLTDLRIGVPPYVYRDIGMAYNTLMLRATTGLTTYS